MALQIPAEVFEYFAADPVGPLWNISSAMEQAPDHVIHGLHSLFGAITPEEVLQVQKDTMFQHLCDRGAGEDRAARIWITERLLSREIARRKLTLIRDGTQNPRPLPYHLAAIADVPVDYYHLVPLSAFKFDGSRLLRNGYAFCVLTTTSAPNSSYWLLGAIYSQHLDASTSVRLDPFLFGPEDRFPAMFYRMWMYGRPLDWERLGHLRQPEHGRWAPGGLSRESEFTDFCWAPRIDGVHFQAEEVPKAQACASEPSRYLHSIYEPGSGQITHLDGALRLFPPGEIERRHSVHVRSAGKLGVRE